MPSGIRDGRLTAPFRVVLLALVLGGGVPERVGAQTDSALGQAMDHEMAGRTREAALAYRRALVGAEEISGPVLGLERVYADLGWTDSLPALMDSLLQSRPRDPMLRTVQLRSLRMTGRATEATAAFERWAALAPRDATPFRTYIRLLIDEGETIAADSLLRRATRALGSSADISLELAQVRASMGLWLLSAEAWRTALARDSYLGEAAVYALRPTPTGDRPRVESVFAAEPATPEIRRVLAGLRLTWGDADGAWDALRTLPPVDSSAVAWLDFADRAEAAGAWSAAREALAAAVAVRPTFPVAARAAHAAMESGDAASALRATDQVKATDEPGAWAQLILPVRIRALAALGRAADAEREVADASGADSVTRAALRRDVARAWVRAGDLQRARAALGEDAASGDDEVAGWLALYEGDLAGARRGLRLSQDRRGDVVLARALLGRTRTVASSDVGAAFLLLARADTSAAAGAFERAAASVPDAAPLVLAAAARFHAASARPGDAVRLWTALIADHASAPEAAEAELAWARSLRASGDLAAAITHLEHLILTWPESALVPQARRELDVVRGRVAP